MPSFDVVSEVDHQEVRNAVDQASRELSTRFDFKGTDSSIELGDDALTLRSGTEDRLKAVRQVLEEKLVRRGVSLKALDYGKMEDASGGRVRQTITLKEGIAEDLAKQLSKTIRTDFKKVTPQIQGDAVRVAAKSKDDLQAVIQALRKQSDDYPVALQFVNYR